MAKQPVKKLEPAQPDLDDLMLQQINRIRGELASFTAQFEGTMGYVEQQILLKRKAAKTAKKGI